VTITSELVRTRAEELADVMSVRHNINRGDVERWMRDVQRAERFERDVWVSRDVLSNVDVAGVLFQSEGAVGR
jgi:hypothetical protein